MCVASPLRMRQLVAKSSTAAAISLRPRWVSVCVVGGSVVWFMVVVALWPHMILIITYVASRYCQRRETNRVVPPACLRVNQPAKDNVPFQMMAATGRGFMTALNCMVKCFTQSACMDTSSILTKSAGVSCRAIA